MPSLAREVFEGLIARYHQRASGWHVSYEQEAVNGNDSSIRFDVTLGGKKRSFSIEAAEHPLKLVTVFEGTAMVIVQTENAAAPEVVALFADKVPVPA